VNARAGDARISAELYALTHRGNPGDAELYLRRARGAKRVLELGCGYGRLLAKLAHPERELTGLEIDPAMLALARRKLADLPDNRRANVRLVRSDMRSFTLKTRYDCVFLPYNALYCLLSQRDALACFRSARAVLEPDGELVLDVWNAAPFHDERRTSGDDHEPIAIIEYAGEQWSVFEHSRVRRASQRIHVSYEYVPRSGGRALHIDIPQRYYLAPQLCSLLGRAGFTITARYGDFSERRYTERSPQLILVARAH